MKTLLEYREKMKLFLGKYDIYIFPVLKFALALIVFLSINGNVGFMSRLTNPGIALVLALTLALSPAAGAITVDEALRAMTQGGAYMTWEEKEKGTLAPGMLADLV